MHENEDTTYIYHRVPYAHASRFQAPTLEEGFDNSLDYRKRGPICFQKDEVDSLWGINPPMQICEECLYLSISTPRGYKEELTTANLPVVVHIHGGAYHSGGGEEELHDLSEFSMRENIVCISINYRLGPFGYLYWPDSIDVDCGLQDQLMALRWVHNNIHKFGGDFSKITLIGQSAGAQSVVYCLSSEHRVPIQRAVVFSAPILLELSKCDAQRYRRQLLRYLPNHNPRTATAVEINAAQWKVTYKHPLVAMPFAPVEAQQMPKKSQVSWPEQVVVCTQEDDGSLFGPTKTLGKWITKLAFVSPSKRYVRYLQHNNVSAQYHLFTWKPDGSPYGAAHCCELPLLMGTVDNWIGCGLMGNVTREELLQRRATFMDQFAHFVRTGEWIVPMQK